MKIVFMLATALCLSACACPMKKLEIAGEMGTIDTQGEGVSVARPSLVIEFADCPTKEQQEQANHLRKRTLEAFDTLLAEGVTDEAVAKYNRVIKAVTDALEHVVFSTKISKLINEYEDTGSSASREVLLEKLTALNKEYREIWLSVELINWQMSQSVSLDDIKDRARNLSTRDLYLANAIAANYIETGDAPADDYRSHIGMDVRPEPQIKLEGPG